MITGWIEVTNQGTIPPGVRIDQSRDYYYHRQPSKPKVVGDRGYWFTEEQECPDCDYRTSISDVMGYHSCPTVKIYGEQTVSVGDFVYFAANSEIRRGVITKYKKSTRNTGVRDISKGSNHTIQHKYRILKAGEDEQRHFEQVINGLI